MPSPIPATSPEHGNSRGANVRPQAHHHGHDHGHDHVHEHDAGAATRETKPGARSRPHAPPISLLTMSAAARLAVAAALSACLWSIVLLALA